MKLSNMCSFFGAVFPHEKMGAWMDILLVGVRESRRIFSWNHFVIQTECSFLSQFNILLITKITYY